MATAILARMATHALPGLLLTDHTFTVPHDPAAPDGATIELFAREVRAVERADDELPWLVFLQGGPGVAAPRPLTRSGWIDRAVEDYRVLLLDQRGTGRSAPVDARTMARFDGPEAQAAWLAHFRADEIVEDCEHVRRALAGDEPWTVLGQSFGGFCATRYLSAHPEGLAAAVITGGLPPLSAHPDEIYRRTYGCVRAKNEAYYDRYPGDVELVRAIVRTLRERDVRLPSGDRLTARRFQTLGLLLGMSDGAETLHYLLEQAFVEGPEGPELSWIFRRGFENAVWFDTNPIFSVLHEACYTQGFASRWSAERVRAEFAEFDGDDPVLFTGEMIYPWLFDEVAALAPLKAAAELLAEKDDWPGLYDAERLARNTVPVVAAVYTGDMYVEREYSLETATAIQGARTWVTNEYEHNGLRADGKRVLGRLLDMLRGAC